MALKLWRDIPRDPIDTIHLKGAPGGRLELIIPVGDEEGVGLHVFTRNKPWPFGTMGVI